MTSPLSRHDRALPANILPSRPWHSLVLSARSEVSLETATRNLVDHLKRNRDLDIADVAFTLQAG
jgi:acyl transferase domain-containing protein